LTRPARASRRHFIRKAEMNIAMWVLAGSVIGWIAFRGAGACIS
jgi:hypothetical protein